MTPGLQKAKKVAWRYSWRIYTIRLTFRSIVEETDTIKDQTLDDFESKFPGTFIQTSFRLILFLVMIRMTISFRK